MNRNTLNRDPGFRVEPMLLATRLRIRSLLESVANNQTKPNQFAAAMTLLEQLPFSTEVFGLAKCRLRNASAAAEAGQFGVAKFELRLLFGSLRNN